MKKVVFGLIILFLAISFFLFSCKSPVSSDQPLEPSNSTSSSQTDSNTSITTGTFQLILTDKPVKNATNIWVTINKIRVHKASADNFIVLSDTPMTVDLLVLKSTPQPLIVEELAAGHYNQIRMAVVSGEIVIEEEGGNVTCPMKVPSSEIKVPVQFRIEEGGTAEVILDFDAEKSVKVTKQGKKNTYILRPVIKVVKTTT